MLRLLSIIPILVFFIGCKAQNCDTLPKRYASYADAIKTIKSTKFKIDEFINTSKSSWIRGAHYYSCDGIIGFLIIKTDDREYIHAGVPLEIWNEFKNAYSYGSYYDNNIKGNYKFNLR